MGCPGISQGGEQRRRWQRLQKVNRTIKPCCNAQVGLWCTDQPRRMCGWLGARTRAKVLCDTGGAKFLMVERTKLNYLLTSNLSTIAFFSHPISPGYRARSGIFSITGREPFSTSLSTIQPRLVASRGQSHTGRHVRRRLWLARGGGDTQSR